LLSHQQRLFDAAVKLFEQYRVTPRVVISTKSVESAFRLSEVGIGITLVPETFTRFCLTDTPPVLFSIGEPLITWSLGVAYCSGSYIPAVAKTFISVIREMYL
jgi:DNA-binding transcriptional LysR family regulator